LGDAGTATTALPANSWGFWRKFHAKQDERRSALA
jgi:hypothetical protein